MFSHCLIFSSGEEPYRYATLSAVKKHKINEDLICFC
jgi:hypothetical protein